MLKKLAEFVFWGIPEPNRQLPLEGRFHNSSSLILIFQVSLQSSIALLLVLCLTEVSTISNGESSLIPTFPDLMNNFSNELDMNLKER